MDRPTRILGVDPGKTTGLVVIEATSSHWTLLNREEVAPTGDDSGANLALLYRVGEVMAARFSVHTIAMEAMLAYGARTAEEKVEAQAIVKLMAHTNRIPIITYAPVTIRATVIGSGRADPKAVSATLRHLLRLGPTSKRGEAFTPHQQDALAVALCCAAREYELVIDQCQAA